MLTDAYIIWKVKILLLSGGAGIEERGDQTSAEAFAAGITSPAAWQDL